MTTKTKKDVDALEKSLNASNVVETLDQLEGLISRVSKAQKIFATYSQEKVDAIFKALKLQRLLLIKPVFRLQEWLLKKQAWVF